MNITVLTHYLPNWQEMADLVLPQRARYCARHGYEHVVQCGPHAYENLYYAIDRLIMVRDLFRVVHPPDLIWVINLGAVIMDESQRIESFIPANSTASAFFHDHEHGPGIINAGSFIVRRSDALIQWLDAIIAAAPSEQDPWKEQATMIKTMPEWKHVVEVVPHPGFNSQRYALHGWPIGAPGDYKPGHFLVHFPGIDYPQRLELVRDSIASATP